MVEIRDVWQYNLEEEMAHIRKVLLVLLGRGACADPIVSRQTVVKYPYVAMDTEFPGVVARPITDQYATDYQYQVVLNTRRAARRRVSTRLWKICRRFGATWTC
jgi:hypothetical protein